MKLPYITLALDRATARRYDADGRLHVEKSNISKSAVNPYYGAEIPDSEALGLQPDKIYRLLRDPEELRKAAPSFARIPLLSRHTPVSADDPQKEIVVGAIGSDVEFNEPYLTADLTVWDAQAIAAIESEQQQEISCGYRYRADMTPGEYEGQAYDGVMRGIIGNHVALVENGRAGSDVVVADSNPFPNPPNQGDIDMKMTKTGKALYVALQAASAKLAQDSALPALVGMADKKTFDKAAVKAKLIALDAEINPETLDKVLDAILDVEQSPEPKEPPTIDEEGEENSLAAYLKSCGLSDEQIAKATELAAPKAADEEPDDDAMKKEDVKQAMDSLESKLRKQFRDLETAKQDVRATVGDVIGMDSAEAVYRFALDHLGIKHDGINGIAALKALHNVAADRPAKQPNTIAQDAANITQKFPGLARFSNI